MKSFKERFLEKLPLEEQDIYEEVIADLGPPPPLPKRQHFPDPAPKINFLTDVITSLTDELRLPPNTFRVPANLAGNPVVSVPKRDPVYTWEVSPDDPLQEMEIEVTHYKMERLYCNAPNEHSEIVAKYLANQIEREIWFQAGQHESIAVGAIHVDTNRVPGHITAYVDIGVA